MIGPKILIGLRGGSDVQKTDVEEHPTGDQSNERRPECQTKNYGKSKKKVRMPPTGNDPEMNKEMLTIAVL